MAVEQRPGQGTTPKDHHDVARVRSADRMLDRIAAVEDDRRLAAMRVPSAVRETVRELHRGVGLRPALGGEDEIVGQPRRHATHCPSLALVADPWRRADYAH